MRAILALLLLRRRHSRRWPKARPDAAARKAEIDSLLGALKVAPSEEAAGALENRIRQLWTESGSPAATLLMGRGACATCPTTPPADARDDFDCRAGARARPRRGL